MLDGSHEVTPRLAEESLDKALWCAPLSLRAAHEPVLDAVKHYFFSGGRRSVIAAVRHPESS
jgi:hypothetical protein